MDGPATRRALAPLLALALAACTGATPRPDAPPGGDPAAEGPLVGTVRFEARVPTERGASETLELRPARLVDLEVRGPSGAVLATGATDEAGRFEIDRPPGAATLIAVCRIRAEGKDLTVAADQAGTQVHELAFPLAGEGTPLDLVARDGAEGGPAGAFHILDLLLIGYRAAEEWTGRDLPPIRVYWGRGITRSWSFYRGEQPEGSGRYLLELLGGQPGEQASTDTDEHDEAIVLHELGHFVMDMVSTDSSTGGSHPPGAYVEPGLAWEEGRVTWFATAVLADSRYWDTIGLEPGGKLRVHRDLEIVNPGPRGVGSEQTVAEILWDLSDGPSGLPDRDGDGVDLGPAGVMRAMMALREEEGAFPSLGSFLRGLVDSGAISELRLKELLAATGEPASVLPDRDAPLWPEILALPAEVTGEIDGLTSPAPSGGPALPASGYDAIRAYRVHLTAPSRLVARLEIRGSGRVADHQDLDLELRDGRARLVAQARTEASAEGLERDLPPGWYVLYVRDGGDGNRAGYTLSVSTD